MSSTTFRYFCLLFIVFVSIHQSLATINQKDQNTLDKFKEWMKNNNIFLNEKLDIKYLDNFGLSIVSNSKIQKNEKLIHVPSQVMMSQQGISKHIPKEIKEIVNQLGISKTNEQAIYLMYSKLNNLSFWNAYTNILPQSFSTTLFFIEKELDELQASPLKQYTIQRKNSIDYHYDNIFSKLSKVLDEFKKPEYTKDLFYWALSCVWSRSFSLSSNDGGMIPLADIFNAEANPEKSKVSVKSTEVDGLHYSAAEDIEKDEQVYTPYGVYKPLSSSQMLMDYGFVFEKGSKADHVILKVPGFRESEDNYDIKRQILERNQITSDEYPLDMVSIQSLDTLPKDLMMYVRVKNLATEEMSRAKSHFLNPKTKHTSMSNRNEKSSLRFLCTIIKKQLSTYPTTYHEDSELLKQTNTFNQENAIKIRMIEKKILETFYDNLMKLREKYNNNKE
ncbi:hypothetical protein DLAC_01885 [Tieghemostelium lacteum]|uniref:SET domain-containing protein n=1 Tax=Tieghemostelium lacteum TaxID=361077 RepID=A0A152A6V6_TIELA|nr:hypothetical protein DLAC_01885 [Tieghemostelium lacteum]|eukprot:KYR01865.1 hypothetical protein DLAC_01885 [Tieghemostelium lacteum]